LQNRIKSSLITARQLLQDFLDQPENLAVIAAMAKLITEVYRKKGKVLIFGNGGSMTDAMHFAEELTGRYHLDRPALPAIALSDPGHLTCVANDYGYEDVFSRGVEAFALPGDVVIGLSTSGNSPNVIKALHLAQDTGCFTLAFLGKDGGKLRDTCDLEIIIPSQDTARIQELHMLILHIIIGEIERELFPGLYPQP